IKRFGSLENAARQAGLKDWPLRRAGPRLSRRETLAALRARHQARLPLYERVVAEEYPKLAYSIHRHFDHWEDALRAARLPNDTPIKRWSDEEIFQILGARLDRGQSVYYSDVRRDEPSMAKIAEMRFGS